LYLRVRTQVQEVLLAMTIKPFLSHRRANATAIAALRDCLNIYGAGGWKDTEDLPVGDLSPDAIRRAIFNETGGFVWWGTRLALESDFINRVEIPAAFERKRKEASYPIVPIFVDLDPGDDNDRQAVRQGLGELGDLLLNANGMRRRHDESAGEFRQRVSRRYIKDSVKRVASESNGASPLEVCFRALSAPGDGFDVTFDWRSLMDADSRSMNEGAEEIFVDALRSLREALQAACYHPEVRLDLDLPLPLAFLLGYEWRLASRIKMTVRQRTGSQWSDISSSGEVAPAPEAVRLAFGGRNSAVVAVSCLTDPGQSLHEYAKRVNASEVVSFHIPGILSEAKLRGLARRGADELRVLNNRGLTKRLILLGPVALAVCAGVASNAVGPIVLPFWNGQEYRDGLVVAN
jgi:hypothetical protein